MIATTVFNLSLSKTGFVLLLKPAEGPADRLLPILIGVAEAQSIALALAGKQMPRPMTHDLMKQLLDLFDTALDHVEITRLEGHTFFARLLLTRNTGETIEVDARPSDAIALALRCGAAILADEEVFDKSAIAIPPELAEPRPPAADSPPAFDPRHQLEEEMKRAIHEERYEDAARIRDQIKQLDHH